MRACGAGWLGIAPREARHQCVMHAVQAHGGSVATPPPPDGPAAPVSPSGGGGSRAIDLPPVQPLFDGPLAGAPEVRAALVSCGMSLVRVVLSSPRPSTVLRVFAQAASRQCRQLLTQ